MGRADPETELSTQAQAGLKNRIANFILKRNYQKQKNKYLKYTVMTSYEINIINSMNYASYFLIVSDYIKWAKKNSIPVGPGRDLELDLL